jgi:HEPN domain-containing protein
MPGHNDWLAKAAGDLRAARKLVRDDDFTLDSAAYHTQQAAEKSLKAYLVFKGCGVPKIHELERLLKCCLVYDASFEEMRNDAEKLSSYATYTRYPDDYFHIGREEADGAILSAARIFKFVKNKINVISALPQMSIFEDL